MNEVQIAWEENDRLRKRVEILSKKNQELNDEIAGLTQIMLDYEKELHELQKGY